MKGAYIIISIECYTVGRVKAEKYLCQVLDDPRNQHRTDGEFCLVVMIDHMHKSQKIDPKHMIDHMHKSQKLDTEQSDFYQDNSNFNFKSNGTIRNNQQFIVTDYRLIEKIFEKRLSAVNEMISMDAVTTKYTTPKYAHSKNTKLSD